MDGGQPRRPGFVGPAPRPGFRGQMRRPIGPGAGQGKKGAPLGLIIGIIILIIIIIIVVVVVTTRGNNNGNGGEEEECLADGGTWDSSSNTCDTGGGLTNAQREAACTAAGDTWNAATSTCTPATPTPTPTITLTPQQQCLQDGGYFEADGTCMTPALCTASGGTFNSAMARCSPYTATSCASVGGQWHAGLLDCINIPPPTGAETYTCICGPGYCGNGATGGDPGTTRTGLSATSVESSYRPCITHANGTTTGWTCTNDTTGANFCT